MIFKCGICHMPLSFQLEDFRVLSLLKGNPLKFLLDKKFFAWTHDLVIKTNKGKFVPVKMFNSEYVVDTRINKVTKEDFYGISGQTYENDGELTLLNFDEDIASHKCCVHSNDKQWVKTIHKYIVHVLKVDDDPYFTPLLVILAIIGFKFNNDGSIFGNNGMLIQKGDNEPVNIFDIYNFDYSSPEIYYNKLHAIMEKFNIDKNIKFDNEKSIDEMLDEVDEKIKKYKIPISDQDIYLLETMPIMQYIQEFKVDSSACQQVKYVFSGPKQADVMALYKKYVLNYKD